MYREVICQKSPIDNRLSYMRHWESDLGETLEDDEWDRIIQAAAKSSICTTLKENAYKVLMRWYYTPTRLAKFVKGYSPLCPKQCGEAADLRHMLWSCTKVAPIWEQIRDWIQRILDLEIPLDPWLFLLGRRIQGLSNASHKLIAHFATATSECYQLTSNVMVSTYLSPCLNDCGTYGKCRLLRRNGYLYAACSCKAGWTGWSCTDAREALSAQHQLTATLLLTFSNLMFLPTIAVAVYRYYFVEAAVYAYTMFFSTVCTPMV
ncbi:hypothetical protein FKM82_022616 [Ascaphus truei]